MMGPPPKPFFDAEIQLTGKPDYLVKEGESIIPVEVKSSYAPAEPYAGHVFQLLAYCYLVESDTGSRPPYGILRYRNRTFAIDYTAEQEAALLNLLSEMREDLRLGELERCHQDSGRCARCGFRDSCDQRL
jgi:CRISPR-associated exonuclease Cas4